MVQTANGREIKAKKSTRNVEITLRPANTSNKRVQKTIGRIESKKTQINVNCL